MGVRRGSSSVNVLFRWVRQQSIKVKIFLGTTIALCSLIALRFMVKDHDHFYIASEAVHLAGIMVLFFKLTTRKTCSGLSLKTQELTAIFLTARLICSTLMERDMHTLLDLTTLLCTSLVIYMIRFRLKSSYIKEFDNMLVCYLVVPSIILAVFIHPASLNGTLNNFVLTRILWAFCVYLESVSILPQLRLMQNAKMIEPFTSHYVFALGVSRFLALADWIIQIYEIHEAYLFLIGNGYFWFMAAFLSEIIQSFILADFCYYYIKSVMQGQLLMRMPV
ncbi:ER lumen protein retaining receptor family protein [Quillaja saponaria]|uniref:ER lumen protein retaining receptor family protein n=1 Tax=Quillaja saponaria TaxID=32244 RepID=A0AAD7PCH9_QUISA|nr:ER lumen protein retaining receptor family protein [Quillaja saponaria]